MKRGRAKLCLGLWIVCLSLAVVRPGSAAGSDPEQETTGVPLRLEDLEAMALRQNPTVAQAAARIRAARGRKLQGGLYPNPAVGYTGNEISTGPIIRGGEHGFFIEQELVTGGKLRLSRSVFEKEERQAEAGAEAQKYRVLNTVRLLYYWALAAARLVELRQRLSNLAHEAVDISRQLYNVGQADQPDLLEAEVEAQQAELALIAAQNTRERVWRELAAVVGVPSLEPAPLAGSLDDSVPELEFESALQTILRESPEIGIVQAALARAEQALKRERVEWIPNIIVRGGLRDNRELLEVARRPVGLQGFIDAGVRIPLFNRNQGNVESARANLERAQLEVERVKLSLRARLAAAYRNYLDSVALVRKYREEMLPRAQRAYELYLARYQQMAAAYPQVLISQRTHFQLQVDYVEGVLNLWRSVVEIRGFLLVDGIREFPMDRNGAAFSTAEEN